MCNFGIYLFIFFLFSMFAASFVHEVKTLSGFSGLGLHDKVDRLNTIITPIIIGVCLAIVGSSAFYLRPMDCFLSTAPGGSNIMDFAKDFCWVHGTIPIKEGDRHPATKEEWMAHDNEDRITYYQWMPFFLGLMALLFYFPYYFWAALSHNRVGTDYEMIVSLANEAQTKSDITAADACLDKAAEGFYAMLCFKRRKRDFQKKAIKQSGWMGQCMNNLSQTLFFTKTLNRALVVGYFIFKVLMLVIAILELYLLAIFLEYKGPFYKMGFTLASNTIHGLEWQYTKWFPRVAFCVVNIRMLGTTDNQYIAQCALSINMVNEKICIFLAFWMLFLIPINTISIISWLSRCLLRSSRKNFVIHQLRKVSPIILQEYEEKRQHSKEQDSIEMQKNGAPPSYQSTDNDVFLGMNKAKLERFACTFMKQDGVFVLRMILSHVGTYTCGRLLLKLWLLYSEDKSQEQDNLASCGSDSDDNDGFI